MHEAELLPPEHHPAEGAWDDGMGAWEQIATEAPTTPGSPVSAPLPDPSISLDLTLDPGPSRPAAPAGGRRDPFFSPPPPGSKPRGGG